ncbi:MAG: hypothetical protein KKF95_07730 [Nanoarchaeota archaeon]|nr:hypothetical protein [Nanoarchaeota archaeon]
MTTNILNKTMKKAITLMTLIIFSLMLTGLASATTCSVASSATVPVSADETITVSCSEIGTGNTVTISPSGFSTSCIRLDSSSKQITATSPSTTFITTGVSLACMMNVPGRTVTWTFTHSAGSSVASKTTVYNVIPTPSITPTFENSTYTVTNSSTGDNVSITLALTTSQSQVDIRNIDVIVTTSINGTIVGLENKTDITIDVSESTTQYLTWNLELPPLPPGMTYDFNVSLTSDNANPAMGTAIINVTEGGVTMYQVSIPLNSGWSLVSLPVSAVDMSSSVVFADISGLLSAVWRYDGGVTWKSYDGADGAPDTLTTLGVVKGYWVKTTQVTSLNITGVASSSTNIPLVAGWNLIGYPSVSSASLTTVLADVLDNTVVVWRYDGGVTWKAYDGASGAPDTLTTMDPGKGYWIKMTGSDTLTVTN